MLQTHNQRPDSAALLSLWAHKSQIFLNKSLSKFCIRIILESVPLGSLFTPGKPDTHQNLSNTYLNETHNSFKTCYFSNWFLSSIPIQSENGTTIHPEAQSKMPGVILGPLSASVSLFIMRHINVWLAYLIWLVCNSDGTDPAKGSKAQVSSQSGRNRAIKGAWLYLGSSWERGEIFVSYSVTMLT